MTELITNQFIPGQFPSFYKKDAENFVAFVKAYYQYLESSNNVLFHTRNLKNYFDIDKTPDEFLQHFKNQYIAKLPSDILVNPRLLMKHVQDLYQAKGTERGYELLFRILFNEDVSFYYPGQHVFRLSNGTWIQQGYIEVTDSPYLANLVGLSIQSSSGNASALVEDYNIVYLNNKINNVLILSNINGSFSYGDFITSDGLPQLTANIAPIIVGSLSAVSIDQGGAFFNVGDVVNVSGSSGLALATVASTTSEDGLVTFNLLNGGQGFSLNAQIQVTGGNGSGASFSVGSLVNEKVYILNTDQIASYYNTQLDNAAQGFNLAISNNSGGWINNEAVTASANGIGLDFAYVSGNNLSNTELLSNTALGISGLKIIEIDNPNYINLTGPESALNNANLKSGVILVGSVSGDTIYVNCVLPKAQFNVTANVVSSNSTVLVVDNANGYFLPTSNVHGQTSGATAYINQTIRNTAWTFPIANGNLDSVIGNILSYETIVAGTIASLTGENPGKGYTANPTVSIQEPLIYQLQLPDGQGGFLGGDASISAIANNDSGIITALNVLESGYGFNPGEFLEIYGNGQVIASGTAVVDGTGKTQGYWKDNQSFLSDTIYLQDSYYYQPFSYEIIAPRMLETYQQFVTDIVHPVQMLMFGRLAIQDVQNSATTLIQSSDVMIQNGNTIVLEAT